MPAMMDSDFAVPVNGSSPEKACTYQLHIRLTRDLNLSVGRLGRFKFVAGRYIYTGSAKRAMAARLRRHLAVDKTLHWHIDYLLAAEHANIIGIDLSEASECIVNQSVSGDIPAPGFGASDCRAGCNSHLKYLGHL